MYGPYMHVLATPVAILSSSIEYETGAVITWPKVLEPAQLLAHREKLQATVPSGASGSIIPIGQQGPIGISTIAFSERHWIMRRIMSNSCNHYPCGDEGWHLHFGTEGDCSVGSCVTVSCRSISLCLCGCIKPLELQEVRACCCCRRTSGWGEGCLTQCPLDVMCPRVQREVLPCIHPA